MIFKDISEIKEKSLREEKTYSFVTPDLSNEDDIRMAEIFYIQQTKCFFIFFNGKPFTYKSFNGMKRKLRKLVDEWKLIPFSVNDDKADEGIFYTKKD